MLVHILSQYTQEIYEEGQEPLTFKDYIKYADDKGALRHITCSSLKAGYAMRLYEIKNRVGIVADARKVDLLYTAANLTGSFECDNEGGRGIIHTSIFPETDDIQKLQESGFRKAGGYIAVPSDVSAEKNTRCLEAIDESWRQIDKMGMKAYHRRATLIDPDLPAVTETIANINNIKDIEAVICTSMSDWSIRSPWETTPLHALAFKTFIKKEFKHDIPVISYNWGKDSGLQFAEMPFDKQDVKHAIKGSDNIAKNLNTLLSGAVKEPSSVFSQTNAFQAVIKQICHLMGNIISK